MSKRSPSKKDSRDIKAEALKLAACYKVEGQSKAHSKLIANGVVRGIEQFLRQQSEKSRDIDRRSKKLKKATAEFDHHSSTDLRAEAASSRPFAWRIWLPWGLLLLSWGLLAAYILR
mgnify:FL=1|tara:strand:- start:2303 stop:2653 length:351 start_codon:yes stop_codon:yes gene_type:complete